MRELVIKNLRLVITAHESDAVAEAHRVVQRANEALAELSDKPVLLFSGPVVTAEYVTVEYGGDGNKQ